MKRLLLLSMIAAALSHAAPPFDYQYDASSKTWTLANGVISSQFELTDSGIFHLTQAGLAGSPWLSPELKFSSPIRFSLNEKVYDERTAYRLIEQHTETTNRGATRQVITLQDLEGTAQVNLHVDLFKGMPVLRFHTIVKNLSSNVAFVTASDMLPLSFSDAGAPFIAFNVNQWSVVPKSLDFQSVQQPLDAAGDPVSVSSGAHGTQVSWLAIRDSRNRGMFAGWEFNGRSAAYVSRSTNDHSIQFSAPVNDLHHPVEPLGVYVTPAAFIGFFQGDWDEAGYRTQRFVEANLARPAPDLERFPYMSWDSWGFQENFDEKTLRAQAIIAADLGVELFIIDLGWAKKLGDWHPDPTKFPNGLKVLSDYVHALGMKFGLHVTPAEASPDSPILQVNPDWASTENDNYFGAVSLCLAHQPVRNWMVNEIVRMIDDYGVDWILQDGENMVKNCTKTTHSHDPLDSNYANSTEGIDWVIEQALAQRPAVSFENCENGGNMMTFKMVENYVTSITNDASGALGSRQGAYGATYPFSPRFADRYSPEDPISTYNTRSYIFGGPWHLMNKLDAMTPAQLSFARSEIDAYKAIRGVIRNGKVFHLLSAPASGRIDAIESAYLGTNAVTVVTREGGEADSVTLRLRGLTASATYRVHFQTDTRTFTMTGQQLATAGVLVNLPDPQCSEILYADRQQP